MSLKVLSNPECLEHLKADIKDATQADMQTYLLEPSFFAELFTDFLKRAIVNVVTDARQRPTAALLLATHNNLRIRTWSGNRTMHTKMILLHPMAITYIGSHNLTRGSFSMSENATLRTDDPDIYNLTLNRFIERWKNSKPVTREG
jgi:phosphatidylserine/phosphatidylglycerophosphate/cardiolipin synthase-like enzyme